MAPDAVYCSGTPTQASVLMQPQTLLQQGIPRGERRESPSNTSEKQTMTEWPERA